MRCRKRPSLPLPLATAFLPPHRQRRKVCGRQIPASAAVTASPRAPTHQFNVRLRRDTLDFIYAQANERNIPVAQVIEEATEALRRAQINRS